jgi:peptidoglycan/LPS O-acetylase OafA/YrhL
MVDHFFFGVLVAIYGAHMWREGRERGGWIGFGIIVLGVLVYLLKPSRLFVDGGD